MVQMINNQDKIPITEQGLEEIKEKHRNLVEKKRPLVVERLVESRTLGDVAEDGEHSQAKQELAFVDGKITELEDVISRAVLIGEGHGDCRRVKLGCQVTVQVGKKQHVFHLVGEWEADPAEKKISHQSPLGKKLLGKKVGDQVEVEAPVGKIVYTIKSVD